MQMRQRIQLFFFLSLLLVASGCTSFDPEVYQASFDQVKQSARKYAAAGQYPESVYLVRALALAEPQNEEIRQLLAHDLAAAPECRTLMEKGWLGCNLSDRVRYHDFPVLGTLVCYPLNRILDVIDLITVETGPCLGVGANASVTEIIGVGSQVSLGETAFGFNRRHLSMRATIDEFVELPLVESRYLLEARGYTGGAYSIDAGVLGLKRPSLPIYQTARDYWAVGAHAEAAIWSANVELHPIEAWDLLAGIFFCDPLHDDIGVTRGIHIKAHEKDAIKNLLREVRRK
jgi:hypothetical protein